MCRDEDYLLAARVAQQHHERDAVLDRHSLLGVEAVDELDVLARHQREERGAVHDTAAILGCGARPLAVDGLVAERLERRLEELLEVVELDQREQVGVHRADGLHQLVPPRFPRKLRGVHLLNFRLLLSAQNAIRVRLEPLILVLAVFTALKGLGLDLRAPVGGQPEAVKEPRLLVVAQIAGEDVVLPHPNRAALARRLPLEPLDLRLECVPLLGMLSDGRLQLRLPAAHCL